MDEADIETYLNDLPDDEIPGLFSDVILDGKKGVVNIGSSPDTLRDKMMVWQIDEPVRWRRLARMIERAQTEQGRMERYLRSLSQNEFLNFYRRIMDKHSLVLHAAERPDFTEEILECERTDPACWIKACRQAGIDDNVPDLSGALSYEQQERSVLIFLYEREQQTPSLATCVDIGKAVGLPASTVYATGVRLEELGFAQTHAGSGHHGEQSYVRITNEGRGRAIELLQQPARTHEEDRRGSWPREHKLQLAGVLIAALAVLIGIIALFA